jgi:hypothetical protein
MRYRVPVLPSSAIISSDPNLLTPILDPNLPVPDWPVTRQMFEVVGKE